MDLSVSFKKDLQWFAEYLRSTNVVYIMHTNRKVPVHLYVDACSTGAGAISGSQAYHAEFPADIIKAEHPICHLDVINAVAAIQTWAPQFHGKLVHRDFDYTTAGDIFRAGHGKNSWIQVCAWQQWLTCATYDITLVVGHTYGEYLTS